MERGEAGSGRHDFWRRQQRWLRPHCRRVHLLFRPPGMTMEMRLRMIITGTGGCARAIDEAHITLADNVMQQGPIDTINDILADPNVGSNPDNFG